LALHKLTDAFVRSCPEGEHPDGGNLYFLRKSRTSASWVFRYKLAGRGRKRMGLGPYPDVTLAAARQMAADCRAELREGKDPLVEREERKRDALRIRPTLEMVAKDAFEAKRDSLKDGGDAARWFSPLELHVLPKIGHITPDKLRVSDIVDVLKPIWKAKAPTAKKALTRLKYILEYASATDNAVDITLTHRAKIALGASGHEEQHHAAIPWQDVPDVFSSLGNSVTHLGFKFYILTVPRVSNVTKASWSEIADGVWTIPKERMKAAREFTVPLSWQAQGILKQAKVMYSGSSDYVFPSPTAHKKGIISENTWNKWLKGRGLASTAHGFRSSFRDWCADNQICERDIAEMCCAHMVKGRVEKAYWRSDMLDQRRKVMSKWAEHVTGLTMDDFVDGFEERVAKRLQESHKAGLALDVTLGDLLGSE